MGNEEAADKRFTWVIKNFSSLESACLTIHSDEFVISGCKWRLMAYPKGFKDGSYLSLYLMVATRKNLPCEWRRHVKFRLTVVNQLSDELSQQRETEQWFDRNATLSGNHKMLLLSKLYAKKLGFLVNDEVKIVAEVDVLEVIGELDVLEASQEVTQPLKRVKLNEDDGASVKESINVNGFQVLPSQVEYLKRIFEKHPDMALEFRVKNQTMRTSCINLLLNVIETLCQSLQDFCIDDLSQAKKALMYLKDSGFKVDWLERKLEEVRETKIEAQFSKTRMQELEEELKVFKKKCLDKEAMLEKEKTKVLAAAKTHTLTLDDVL
ncbi:MATH domain and coiled-coil domain-containing protein At3g44790-like isoform X2 [Capsella rubella]|uniref:MATH domain and coiled-coil domain-containing protein At3g44790-like isoform X2 n=1 Tax=Capsella rubella TaxID=81985 RepID=UPI000CD4C419|nr:MATH domain and coiled-coil domain-containing protein At3g44790-like isoform X2 [Capsella rubella]